MSGIRDHALACLGEGPLLAGNAGVQLGCLAVASRQRVVQLMLRVGEKLVGRSCFGAGTGNAGDPGLRAGRCGVVFAACDDQGPVLVFAGLFDGVVERISRIPGLLEGRRRLRDGRRRVGVAQRPFVQPMVDRAGKYDERGELADDNADARRDGRTSHDAGPAPAGPACGAAGYRADQQPEHEGERRDGEHRPARRLAHRQAGHQPGQQGSEQDDRADPGFCGMGGPLVALTEFAPVSAAEPSERPLDPGYKRAGLSQFLGAHELQTPPCSSSLAGQRPTRRIEALPCGVVHIPEGGRGPHRRDTHRVRSALPPPTSDAKLPRRERISGRSGGGRETV